MILSDHEQGNRSRDVVEQHHGRVWLDDRVDPHLLGNDELCCDVRHQVSCRLVTSVQDSFVHGHVQRRKFVRMDHEEIEAAEVCRPNGVPSGRKGFR